MHDLGATLRGKGIAFDNQRRVFVACNPGQAAKVPATDMQLIRALPCRISVYTDKGGTDIGMTRPAQMLATLSDDPALAAVAAEAGARTLRMIDEAQWPPDCHRVPVSGR